MIESLRESVDSFKHIYVLSFENMRASLFKDVRIHWRESRYVLRMVNIANQSSCSFDRIYLGKNSVAQIALGKSPEDEYRDNLRHISDVMMIFY